MRNRLDVFVERMRYRLQPFGQYLAMAGAQPGEQRFGMPEITLACLALIGWGMTKFLSAYLDELGRRLANPQNDPSRQDIVQLKALLESLKEDIRTLRRLVKSDGERVAKYVEHVTGCGHDPAKESTSFDGTTERQLRVHLECLLSKEHLLCGECSCSSILPDADLEQILRIFGLTKRAHIRAMTEVTAEINDQIAKLQGQGNNEDSRCSQ